jgi:hypothetical protein
MPSPTALISVDEQLLWVVRIPECVAGSARSVAPDQVAGTCAEFDALAASLATGERPALDDLAALAAHLALRALADLPDLPFIGEPFGGEGGTD